MGQESSGKTSGSTSSTATQTPDPTTDAWRQNVFNTATQQLSQGPYTGQTLAPPSSQTQAGLAGLSNYYSQTPTNLEAANGANSRALSGYNPAMAPAARVANGGGAGANTMGMWANPANINPYLDSEYSAASKPVINSVNSEFAQAGRFGQNAATAQGLTNGLGNLSANIYSTGYENAANRSLAAANDQAANQNTGIQELGSLYNSGTTNALNAEAALPSLYNYGASGATGLLNTGSIYDQQQQAIDTDQQSRYNAPWNMTQQYASMMSGLPTYMTVNQNGTSTGKTSSSGISASFNPATGFSIGG